MSMESEIRDVLLASPAITAIVGSRVWFGTADQGTSQPFILLTRVSTSPANTFEQGRAAQKPTRLDNIQLQASCFARTYESANVLTRAVRNALEEIEAPRCLTVDQRADYDDFPDLHGQFITFSVWYRSNVIE